MVREAGKRTLRMRHFDVQLIGGMVLHDGKIAEMRTGEGKTLVATLPAYLNALPGNGVHIVTVNDYLAKRDAEWMGKIFGFLGLTVGVNLPYHELDSSAQRHEARRLPGRHHLRHQQRIRLRLPARQHGDAGRGALPEEAQLRHRRRGGFDPDRRGAHAADHLRPGRGPHRDLLPHERRGAAAHAAERGEEAGRAGAAGRFLRRREEPPGAAVGSRAPEGRGDPRAHRHAAAGREPLRAGLHQPGAPPVRRAARALPVPPRPALRRAERRSGHRRRVHRPPDDRAALVRRPAPGGGGEGKGGDPEREPDARLDHLPELLPPVRQAGGHDRHRRHGGLRVPGDLRPGDGGGADPHEDDPRGPARPGLSHDEGKAQGDHRRDQGLLHARPAGAGRHHLDREFRAAVGDARRRKSCRTRC